MPKRRSPHKRKTKPRPSQSTNNLVAKHAIRVCKSGPMTNRKKAKALGYIKHKGLDPIVSRLFQVCSQ